MSSLNQFHRTLREQVYSIQTNMPKTSADLQPPFFLYDALAEMRTLMNSYDTSISQRSENRDEEFGSIVEEALDPYITCCISMADADKLDKASKSIYLLNCFEAIMVCSTILFAPLRT